MVKQTIRLFALPTLLLGLMTGTARSQTYFPFAFTNTLSSSWGGSSLLGIALGPNTSLKGIFMHADHGGVTDQGGIYCDGQIEFTLSDRVASLNEVGTGNTNVLYMTQDLNSSTLTFSSVSNSTP
jgi:hypothetical protein